MRKLKLLMATCFLVIGSLLLLPQLPRVAHSQQSSSYGDPLPDLTPEELRLFEDGKSDFEFVREIKDGLGPGFNGRSCGECHSTPASGGASTVAVTRFGRIDDEEFDGLEYLGGTGLQMFTIEPRCQERIPSMANVIARRLTLPIFGDGLIEAIPDEDIIANAERQAKESMEMAGRVHMVFDLTSKETGGNEIRAGRFGWKAQQATLLSFSADAYLNEMGITTRFLPKDKAPNGDEQLLDECDHVPDPEDKYDPRTQLFGVDKFANFMRFLAPPPRGPKSSRQVAEGEKLFINLDCGFCHTPMFTTGPNKSAALDRKPVAAYSDFLLHDIGTGDNISQGDATGKEIRTTPLWGARARSPYLHDGSAPNLEEAILRHGRQAEASRVRYQSLGRSLRESVLAFLNSL